MTLSRSNSETLIHLFDWLISPAQGMEIILNNLIFATLLLLLFFFHKFKAEGFLVKFIFIQDKKKKTITLSKLQKVCITKYLERKGGTRIETQKEFK